VPIGQIIFEAVAQVAMEAGGNEIQKRWGAKGCMVVLILTCMLIAGAWFYFTR
jgi:hypothetical protein